MREGILNVKYVNVALKKNMISSRKIRRKWTHWNITGYTTLLVIWSLHPIIPYYSLQYVNRQCFLAAVSIIQNVRHAYNLFRYTKILYKSFHQKQITRFMFVSRQCSKYWSAKYFSGNNCQRSLTDEVANGILIHW